MVKMVFKMVNNYQNVRVLLAGLGSIGKRHASVLSSIGIKEILIYDTDRSALEQIKQRIPYLKPVNSYQEGLAKADAAFILTPPKLHIPMAVEAMERGLDVFCEKPISDTADGLEELAATIRRTDKKFMVGLCFRYHPGIIKLKNIVDSGRLGRIVSIRSLMGEHLPSVRPDYKNLFSSKYLGALDLMHDLDLAIWFAGYDVKNFFFSAGSYSDIGIEAPDVAEFLLEFPNCCIGTVHLDFFQQPRRRELELICTEGTAKIEFGCWDEYILSVYTVDKGRWEVFREKTMRDDMFFAEDLAFLKAVAENKPIECTFDEGAKSLRIISEVQKRMQKTQRNAAI